MASTYSDLKIQLMTTGENSTTWGSITNTNLGTAIEEAIAGSADVTFASNNVTLTLVNTNATQVARNMRLNLTGTTGGSTRTLTVPNIEKLYAISNTCADSITIKNSTGTTVTVPASKSMFVFSTGTGVVDVTTHLSSLTLGTALASSSGGTGLTSPGANGNVLTSNGSAWTSAALPTAFSTGMIMMWAGSIATIPSGWQICDGTNGSPDLRDRFVVGAGSTYAVAATGGSANAIVVSHTHTATSTVTDPGHSHASNPWQNNDFGGGVVGGVAVQNGGNGTVNLGAFIQSATTGVTVSTSVASSGSSGINANLPPYYALAYIMKL